MEQLRWKTFFNFLQRTFYTEIIVILASFLLLYITIRYFHKRKYAHLFLLYAISCLFLFVGLAIQSIYFPLKGLTSTIVIESANTLFSISELSIFIVFFFQIIESKNSKKLLLLFLVAFFISVILFLAKVLNLSSESSDIMKASLVVLLLEFLIFLVAILSYFMELFTKPPTRDLARSPAFWISSGLFIYILASLPVILFAEYVWLDDKKLYYSLFSLHFLSLSLLLATIIKAFLCGEPLTN